jgi:polysaccharide export outer membrane protein
VVVRAHGSPTKGGSVPAPLKIMTLPKITFARLAPLALCITLAPSCMFLPSSGPSGSKILKQAGKDSGNPSYQLIRVNDQVLRSIATHSAKAPYLAASGRKSDDLFGRRGIERFGPVNPQAIAIGDVINVAIYETDSSLFGPSMISGALAVSPMTPLPPQTVDQTGEISVPFVGRVRALGRRTGDVENDIKESLKMKTSDPQVVVTMADRKGGNLISIAGDVRNPSLVPVSLAGTKLIDAIAAAGGSVSAAYDTMVSVTRNNTTRSDTLQDVYNQPSKNISLKPGDTIVLRKRALTFLTFGSTGRVGSNPITVEDLSLSDAIAASGGPSDMQANPATIFVYRQEPVGVLRALGKTNLAGNGVTAPVIYQLDLQDPKGFFYANNFNVRDRDLIYYAPAGSNKVMKFMSLVNTFLAPAISGASAVSSAKILSE